MPAKNLKPHINDALRKTLALVLAGGRGTRLKDLTDNEAKPAVYFGGKYRLIDFPLSNCVNSGIRRVGVATQYRSHNLIQHVQRGWGFFRSEFNEFIQVWPAQQSDTQSWYEGTADAVFQNLDLIESQHADYILILGGDHIYKQDYSLMLEEHIKSGADISVACVETGLDAAKEFGVMGVDASDRVVSFTEKPAQPAPIPDKPDQALASMGIYIFNATMLRDQLLRDAELKDSSHDFGKDIIPFMVSNGNYVHASRFSKSCVRESKDVENYWRDVGTVDAYWEANIDLTHVTPALNLYDPRWSIWTYQVQRPAAKFVFDDNDRRGMGLDAVVSSGCVVSGSTVRRSLLFSDVRVNSYGLVEDSVVLPRTDIGRRCILKKVVVAKDCKIPDGLVVGEDPEEDARWFYRTKGGICLITQPTLEKWFQAKGKK
ncbi:MAG: glucose-1-phosphate adenylyltransferase [Magnetococcales bacterium]|nr:glucose-1-phosphate adenylyltransferase [Magnetococcales bacterium]MBF0149669.1 glucose-1-phosphate adenylyltransferase [Magnetococcales bacterium]MBF0172515.1 glucose-1-phosphate adenylyltransferase [Magnetococcales bacterium]